MKQRKIYEVSYTGKTKDVTIACTTMDSALQAGKALHPKATVDGVRRANFRSTVYIPEL